MACSNRTLASSVIKGASETMDHILLQCYFSREVWHVWLDRLHLQEIVIINDEPALQWWLWTRKLIPKPIRRGNGVYCGRKSGCNVILGCVRGWVEGFSNLGVTVPSCVYLGAPTPFCLMKNAPRHDRKKKV
jgi:hypothetical protein